MHISTWELNIATRTGTTGLQILSGRRVLAGHGNSMDSNAGREKLRGRRGILGDLRRDLVDCRARREKARCQRWIWVLGETEMWLVRLGIIGVCETKEARSGVRRCGGRGLEEDLKCGWWGGIKDSCEESWRMGTGRADILNLHIRSMPAESNTPSQTTAVVV